MVVMGRVSAPHGVKGWIKVQPFTQEIDGLLGYPRWWLGSDREWWQHRIAESAVHGALVLARLEGCTDREAAGALKGAAGSLPRRPPPPNPGGGDFSGDLPRIGTFYRPRQP